MSARNLSTVASDLIASYGNTAKNIIDAWHAGGERVVSRLVKLAETGVERVAANASAFEEKTGVTTLDTLAKATAPGALVLSRLAAQIEQTTAGLASKISGSDVATASVKRSTAFRERRAARAA